MNVCFTFTSEQLEALRRVFSDRLNGDHGVDVRGRLYFPWSRYYLVFQAGRDRRKDLRRNVGTRANRTIIHSALCAVSITALLATLAWLATALR
jgi:hypothetical protein